MLNFRKYFVYKQKILSFVQLKRLSEHRYACSNVSLLDPFLQPWWCWLVSKVPLWLAPNLITVIGLAINILTTLILVFFSPNAREEAPRWASALCALGLFIYQSLDAIDGKQARRTNSSNPLGELFDHGCDSISTVFVALSACISARLGFYPKWMFFQCFCAMILFYCAHWQTYVSGTLRFGRVDVTEAQCTIIGIHMISAIFGSNIWMAKIPFIGNCSLLLCLIFFVGYMQVFIAFLQIFVTGGVGKNGSTVAGTSVISPVIPFALVVVPAFIISEKSVDHIFEMYPSLYILAFGMVAAKVTNKLVIAHMTRSEMEYLDSGLVGPLLLFLNQYFNYFLPEYLVLWIAMLWSTFDLLRYCAQVCLEICDHLNVRLFRIPYPPKFPTSMGEVDAASSATSLSANAQTGIMTDLLNGTQSIASRKPLKSSKRHAH